MVDETREIKSEGFKVVYDLIEDEDGSMIAKLTPEGHAIVEKQAKGLGMTVEEWVNAAIEAELHGHHLEDA